MLAVDTTAFIGNYLRSITVNQTANAKAETERRSAHAQTTNHVVSGTVRSDNLTELRRIVMDYGRDDGVMPRHGYDVT